jgi:tetratricopeptide (TPR) repeat protein
MARRGGDSGDLERIFKALDAAQFGLHDLDEPTDIPDGAPEALIELYSRCGGARLFVGALEIVPPSDVEVDLNRARWRFAVLDGDAIAIDPRGRIWRADESIEDDVVDGTRLDRWLAGQLDALALIYDGDGEYADDVFDEDGELVIAVRESQLRAQIKRDAAASGPRWRLAQVLLEQGADVDARNELEQVVADDPVFAWAWLDLARVSERLGEARGAIDEARMAAEAAEGAQHPQAGYFWAQLARLAVRGGDELVRAEAATKASLLAPDLKRAQIEGARERLDAGDTDSAKGLLDLLRAVWPRDLEVLDLAKRLVR